MKHVIRRFTLEEFWARAQAPNKFPGNGKGSRDNGKTGGHDLEFFGHCPDYASSLELMRHGWAEGAKMTAKVSGALRDRIAHDIPSPQMVYDVAGEYPDVGEFMSGEPEHMVRTEMVPTSARVIRVVVGCGASGGTPGASLIARGAVVCAAIDAIEAAGVRCEIVAGKQTGWGGLRWEAYVTIKRADEPLNMDRVAYCLAHPSFFRRQFWHCYETEEASVRSLMGGGGGNLGGYGHTENCTSDLGDLYIPAMSYNEDWTSPEGSAKLAIEMIRNAGIVTEA